MMIIKVILTVKKIMNANSSAYFAPQLLIKSGVTDISFYSKAFDAVELRRWSNADGTVHVAELSIQGAIFHLHEDNSKKAFCSPETLHATTTLIGLFVADVKAVFEKAIAAGATEISPVRDYNYEYRQGELKDPFGHVWIIEKKI
jgi:PhnB protein